MKLPFKSSFWINALLITLIQRFSLFFFGLVGFFILAHFSFSKEQIGVYALFQTIITMVEYVKMGLLRNALIKFLHDSRFSGHRAQVQSASLFINIVFTLLVILLLLAGGKALSVLLKTEALAPLLNWSILLLLLQVPFNHCEIIQQSHLIFKITFVAYLIRQGVLFMVITGAFIASFDLLTVQHLVFAQIAGLFLSTAYFLVFSRKLISGKMYFEKNVILKLLQFGKYVFGTATLSHIYKFADHFVTAFAVGNPLAGKVYVSYYSVVSRIGGVLDLPFMAVADVLFPKNAQAVALAELGKVKFYFEKMVGTLTALIVPASIFIFFVPELIIRIVAGSAYLDAVPILRVTMAVAFLRPFFSQFGYTMDSIGKPDVNFFVNLVFLALNLLTTYLSIRWFGGLMGAVYATAFTTVSGCLLFYFILHRSLGVEAGNIVRHFASTYSQLFNLLKRKSEQ